METVIRTESFCSACGADLNLRPLKFICYHNQPCKYGHQQAGIGTTQPNEINTVLAVSGQNESIQRLASLYLGKQFIDYGDQNEQAEQQILQAFTAGYQAACASGAVDKTVSVDKCQCYKPEHYSTCGINCDKKWKQNRA